MPVRSAEPTQRKWDDGTNSAMSNFIYDDDMGSVGLAEVYPFTFALNDQITNLDGEVFLKGLNGVQFDTSFGHNVPWDGWIEWVTGNESFAGGTPDVPELCIYKNGVLIFFASPAWNGKAFFLGDAAGYQVSQNDEIAISIRPNTGGPGAYQVQDLLSTVGFRQRYA